MCTKKTFTIVVSLLLSSVLSFSQIGRSVPVNSKIVKLNTNSKLTWYNTAMKNLLLKPATNSSSSVISQITRGANRVEIGVGLTGSERGFTPNGNSRQREEGSTTCIIQPMKIDYLTDNNFNLFESSEAFLPGQFFNINSFLNNSFTSFNGPERKPYQLGINIFNAANPGPNMLNVTDLSRKPLPEIQSTLLAPNYGAFIPAEGIFDMIRINTSYELRAQFNTSQGIFLPLEEFGIPADITAGMEAEGDLQGAVDLKYYMVHFIQPMYTLNVLTNNNELFQNAGAHASCTNAAYVESVTYGRRIVIIIASVETDSKVRGAISAALSASVTGTQAADLEVGQSVSGESDFALRNVAQKFHAKIYGGEGSSANRIFSDIVDFKQAFRSYINSSSASRFGPSTGALPLHYTVRRISDNSLLSVRSVGSFDDLVSCNTSKYKVEVLWKGFTVNKVIEFPGDDKEDIYGVLKMGSVSTNGSTQNKNITIKNIPLTSAISKRAGETDNDDIAVQVMNDVDKNSLVNSILNFNQAFFDVDVLNPAYKENSSAELKFNFSNFTSQINGIAPGQSRVFDNNISLTEHGPVGESKITLLTKIRVTRN